MSTPLIRTLLALLTLVPLSAGLGDSVSPTSIASGTVVTIQAPGLGTKKAKVKLVPTAGQEGVTKARAMKVIEQTDTMLMATLRKAVAGEYRVEVTPKGGETITLEDLVRVELPEIIEIVPADAQPGDEIELRGRFIGDKRGSVKVGGLRGKVLEWERNALTGPGDIVDFIRLRLSKNAKKTKNGPQRVVVRNRLGEVEAEPRVNMSGGAMHTYRATFDGDVWDAVTNTQVGLPGYDPNGLGGISMTGFSGKPGSKKMRALSVAVAGFDPTTFAGELPFTISGSQVVNFNYSRGVGPTASIWISNIGLPLADGDPEPSVTITKIGDGTITGVGQALGLMGISGDATGTSLDVTDFEFSIPMIPE